MHTICITRCCQPSRCLPSHKLTCAAHATGPHLCDDGALYLSPCILHVGQGSAAACNPTCKHVHSMPLGHSPHLCDDGVLYLCLHILHAGQGSAAHEVGAQVLC
jgi:hypothetical protein